MVVGLCVLQVETDVGSTAFASSFQVQGHRRPIPWCIWTLVHSLCADLRSILE